MLRVRTGIQFPPNVVERVLQLTDGRPQLIDNTPVQTPAEGTEAGSWQVGKLREEGIRVLDATIQRRSGQARDVLQAAALSSVGRIIDASLVAKLTELPPDSVEQILDAESQRGPILDPTNSSYSFQHDNWIDALSASIQPARRRSLHAQCLAFLRTARIPDPLQLAQHAIGAGTPLVTAAELAAMIQVRRTPRSATTRSVRPRRLYEAATRYAVGEEHVELLIGRAAALRFRGRWEDARGALARGPRWRERWLTRNWRQRA